MYKLSIDGDRAKVTVSPPDTFSDLLDVVRILETANIQRVEVTGPQEQRGRVEIVDAMLYHFGLDVL